MAVYMNAELYEKYRRKKEKPPLPVVKQKEIDRLLTDYGKPLITDIYTDREVIGLTPTEMMKKYYQMNYGEIEDAYEGYKKINYKGYSKEPVIYVPPWNDIIHLVDEKQLDEEEQRRRTVQRIQHLQRSPTPEVAQNIATILTAIDDVQDFCTTIGVGARILEYATKAPHILSEGMFTSGALLNSMQLHNKIPYEKLNPAEILRRIKGTHVDLDKLDLASLKALKHELKTIHPDWDTIPKGKQKEFMRDHYKITRERWGMPLKAKKRMAELHYSKGTPWGKIQTEVDKRLKRVLPTHGELCEIGQTSDQIAGIGISLGPIMGFATDLIFGTIKGVPIKVSKQKISPEEKKVITDAGNMILNLPMETMQSLQYFGNAAMKASYMIGAGEDLGVDDFLKAVYVSTQAAIEKRGKELRYAIGNVWEKTKNWIFTPGPKTSNIIKKALVSQGIDPTREEGFPCPGLGKTATLEEVSLAFLERAQKTLRHFQAKLDTQVEGEFLASCLHAHALSTACFMGKDGAVIKETFMPELNVYTRAVDFGLEPPIYSTNEQFTNWHAYVMDKMKEQFLEAPNYEMLYKAKRKFFPPEEVL